MASESITSLELAAAAAAIVLTTRLFALIQATRGVPTAHAQIVDALNGGNLDQLRKKTHRLGNRSPYAEVASELVQAIEQEEPGFKRRGELVAKSAKLAKKRMERRTQQGQLADSASLLFAAVVVLSARKTLPDGPMFWSLSGAVVALLVFSIFARSQLKASVLASLDALQSALIARPELPSLSGEPIDCLWCGGPTKRSRYRVESLDEEATEEVDASLCLECGKFVANLEPPESSPSSSDEDEDSMREL